MNATAPQLMFRSTTTSIDRAWRLGSRSRLQTQLRRYTVAALLLAVGSAANAGDIERPWAALVSGDIIGEFLPLGGVVDGTFAAPQRPAAATITDHGVVHVYKGTNLTAFAITLSGGERLTLNSFFSFGSLSSPQNHTHGFTQSNFERGGGQPPYQGSVASVSAVGAHIYAPIPEPSTYALMAAGLAAVVWQRRRKQS